METVGGFALFMVTLFVIRCWQDYRDWVREGRPRNEREWWR